MNSACSQEFVTRNWETLQFAQHDALRAEDDGGGLPSSKFGRAEDGHRFMSRGDHVNGVKFGRSVSTLELNLSPYDGVAANEHQEIRRPRRRPRFPPPRYQMKEKVFFLTPILHITSMFPAVFNV